MNRQFDIAPARKELRLTQRDVEMEMKLPAGSLGAIEDGRIKIDEETYHQIHAAMDRLAGETKECEKENWREKASATT